MSSSTEVVTQLNDAMNRRDLEATLALLTDDCVFEDTEPAPDGTRYAGRAAIGAAWRSMFDDATIHFETEEIFTAGDRVVVRSRYSWGDGHVRGANLYRVRDGQVCEILCYVKG